jgi:hypothetical protein
VTLATPRGASRNIIAISRSQPRFAVCSAHLMLASPLHRNAREVPYDMSMVTNNTRRRCRRPVDSVRSRANAVVERGSGERRHRYDR